MIQRLRNRLEHRNRERGFTLIELLIVIAIIGIIAAILIPNLLDAIQKAKQKRTVADERNIGTAIMSYITDESSAAAAGRAAATTYTFLTPTMSATDLEDILKPTTTFFYLQKLQRQDGWGHAYKFALRTGSTLLSSFDQTAIGSPGRHGVFESGAYTVGAFLATRYDQDIVWADGFFVRGPAGRGLAFAP